MKKHLIALAAILLCFFALFGWAGYTFLPDAWDRYQREIVNDDYSTLTAPLLQDGEIRQQIEIKGTLYGIILNVATFDRVPHGTLHLRLYAPSGNLAATCDTDMTQLLDNTFHRFMLDAPVVGKNGTFYQLSLTASPETPEDAIAFHRSQNAAEDFVSPGKKHARYSLNSFTLSQNGSPEAGTLAIQYVTRYAGMSVVKAYCRWAAGLCVAVAAAYVLLVVLRVKLPLAFACVCLMLGLCTLFLLPAATGGQAAFIADSYHYANRLCGWQDSPEGMLRVRGTDQHLLKENSLDPFIWQDQSQKPDRIPTDGSIFIPASRAQAAPVLYLPQIIGILAARLLGLSTFWLLLLPRLLNLLAYVAVIALALARLPVAKPLLAGVALLPFGFVAGISFSPGGLALACSYLLAALCAQYMTCARPLLGRHGALLAVCAGLSALYSPVLAVAALVVTAVPLRRYAKLSTGIISLAAVLIIVGLTCVSGLWHPAFFASPAGESGLWLKTLLAGLWDAGSLLKQLNWVFLLILLGIAAMLAVPYSRGPIPSLRARTNAGSVAALCAFAAILWGQWMPIILLLALVPFSGWGLRFRRDVSRPLLVGLTAAAALVQLNAMTIILRG